MYSLLFRYSGTLLFSLIFFGQISSAFAQLAWQGTWETNFGPLKLIQQGKRVYGDYSNLGVLEGVVSANSTVLRGTFQRDDGKWGTFHFLRQPQGFSFKGRWRFSGISKRGDGKWDGKRLSGKSPKLFKAVGKKRYWAPALGLVPEGNYKRFVENKPTGIKLPAIPGVTLPGQQSGNSAPARPVLPNTLPRQPGVNMSAQPLGFGAWHGAWLLSAQSDAYEFRLDVDHFKGAGTAQVSFDAFTLKLQHSCPRTMHPELCREMQARFQTNDPADFKIRVNGVEATPTRLKVSFEFINDRVPRLLILEKDARSPTGYRVRLFHIERGVDLAAFVRPAEHICASVPCASDRLTNLRQDPVAFRGVFSDGRYETRFPRQKDERQAAHEAMNRGANGPSAGRPRPSGTGTATGSGSTMQVPFSGQWQLFDASSLSLGFLRFNSDATGASGTLQEQVVSGSDQPVEMSILSSSVEAADYALSFANTDIKARLLITLPPAPGRSVGGTLIQGQFWQFVSLVKKAGAGQAAAPAVPDEADFNDLPGSGVTGPAYRLRNVPAGRNLVLRQGPGRQAAKLDPIPSSATEILVYQCSPEIDPVAFDRANRGAKRALLGGSWCLISHQQSEGYVPGIYLDPILGR